MCLLERIVAWDEREITIATTTHASPQNPLRCKGRLRAIHLCEYGAQAMAVHGGLIARAVGSTVEAGMLVSLRDVVLSVDTIDGLEGELLIEASLLLGGPAGRQYEFRVTHRGAELARGRAAVIDGAKAG